jgi:hypothetical protein
MFPRGIVWLVAKSCDTYCEDRIQCARHMITLSDGGQLADTTILKFVFLFRKALECIIRTGYMPGRLWSFVWEWVLVWDCDTQDVEATNSILRNIVLGSPNIGWESAANRITIKKGTKASETCTEFIEVMEPHFPEANRFWKEDTQKAKAGLASRFSNIEVGDYPLTNPQLRARDEVVGNDAKTDIIVTTIALFKQGLKRLGIPFEASTDYVLQLQGQPVAVDPYAPAPAQEVWWYFFALKFGYALWVTRAQVVIDHEDSESKGLCQMVLPFEPISMRDAFGYLIDSVWRFHKQ